MSHYFDFVLCKTLFTSKTDLFHAPSWSTLKKGDLVVVETSSGEQMATVMATMTLSKDNLDGIDFVMTVTGADTNVRKVLSKVEYRTFDYEEDSAEETTDETTEEVNDGE